MPQSSFICVIQLRLHFGDSSDLKQKRKLLHSLKAHLHKRFGAAVAETGGHDTWQRSELVCLLVGDRTIEARGEELIRFAEARFPDGCSGTLELRSLGDVLG